jgi:hypothetical protein
LTRGHKAILRRGIDVLYNHALSATTSLEFFCEFSSCIILSLISLVIAELEVFLIVFVKHDFKHMVKEVTFQFLLGRPVTKLKIRGLVSLVGFD